MHLSKETNAGQVGLDKHLQTSLNSIERKAKYKQDHKFENLYKLLNKWNLGQSWQYINKSAAKGIDKASAKEFQANLTQEVTILEAIYEPKFYATRYGYRKGKDLITHTTSKKKFNASAKKMKQWLRERYPVQRPFIESLNERIVLNI